LVPGPLQDLIMALLDAVRAHPQHALLPFQRQMVYDYFGLVTVASSRRRRGWLTVMTVERVLPVWQQARPNDDQAERLLVLARDVLQDKADLQIAIIVVENTWDWFMNDYGDRDRLKAIQQSEAAFRVLGATLQSLFIVVGQDGSEGCLDEQDYTDADVDAWSMDTAGWAVAAFAGPVWAQDSDNTKRLEFWTWWLATAVPTAWEAAT